MSDEVHSFDCQCESCRELAPHLPSSFAPPPFVRPELTTEFLFGECDRIQRKIDKLKAELS